MVQLLLTLNDEHISLINIVTRNLGNYVHYDELSIYEHKHKFEIITRSIKKQYVTRTYIGKYNWKILNSYCKIVGQEEIEIHTKTNKYEKIKKYGSEHRKIQ